MLPVAGAGMPTAAVSHSPQLPPRRANNVSMRGPVIHPFPAGTFAGWMKRRGKLGGQNKVPRIITDATLFDDLKSFAGWV